MLTHNARCIRVRAGRGTWSGHALFKRQQLSSVQGELFMNFFFFKRFYSSHPVVSPCHDCLCFKRVLQLSQIAAIKPGEPSDGVIKANVWHI